MENQSSFSPGMRITATVALITFVMLILEPTAVAAQVLHAEHQQAVAEAARLEAAKLGNTLQTVETTLLRWQKKLGQDSPLRQAQRIQSDMGSLKQQYGRFR